MITNPKPRPNHRRYVEILRRMTPEQKLAKVFELSEFAKALFRHGLRKRLGDIPEEQFRQIWLERIEKCHNRNY